jgi:drug/metabolite transporter (DMT)-like permease
MLWLLIVSFIWAFSFGLIKTQLTGLDSALVSFIRLLISFFVFLPFLRFKNLEKSLILRLFLTGMIQYGLMYLTYIYAYRFLAAYEIALFTIFTPLYITLFNDLFSRKFHKVFFMEAFFAVLATAVIIYNRLSADGLISGFILIQISNLSFAFGQIYYKKLLKNTLIKDSQIFALLYGGAVLLTGLAVLFTVNFSEIQITVLQIYTLLYLGVIASGLGFFLWNYGARRTNTGTLSIFNNLKIPFAITVSLLFFGEQTDILRLAVGLTILLLLMWYNEIYSKN